MSNVNILFDFHDIEKTCRNLIHGLPSRVKINVSGHIYEIYTGILDAYPETLLGNPERREKYRLNDEMLFFNRHPSLFSYILFYYIHGFIQKPTNIPNDVFIEECRFFSIPYHIDEDENLIVYYREIKINEITLSKSFNFVCLLITILSCFILFFNDLPKSDFISNQLIYNSILSNTLISWIDMICSIWFMIEYYIRYIYLSNENLQFFIDIISILPILFSLLIHSLSYWFPYLTLLYPFYICLKSFRVIRFIRYIPNLNLIIKTLVFSLNYLSNTLILFSIFIIPFGIIIYLIERTDPYSNIVDVNIGLSWAIETLTTIGYGEYIPHTYLGRCLAIFTCIFGFIILALPIPSVFRKFQIIYLNFLKRDLWKKYY